MRRVVSLWLPTWPTDRVRRKTGAPPPDEPLVTARHDGGRRIVAAADAAARTLGLRPGSALTAARARVPGLVVTEADPVGDAADLAGLATWCRRYTPMIAADLPDGLWLDVTGAAHLRGGEAAMLADLTGRLERAGLAARAALAATPGAAHALARHGRDGDHPIIVAAEDTAAALAGLPVAALRLPGDVVDDLRRLGLERIGQLIKMPRPALALRFGLSLTQRLDQALEPGAEAVAFLAPPAIPSCRLMFAEPIAVLEDLRAAIAALSLALCHDLAARELGARRLDLAFDRVDGRALRVRIGTARPSREPAHLERLLAERLATVDPGFGVEAMTLAAPLSEFLPARQLAATALGVEDARDGGAADLAPLVDRLTSRLGAKRVFRLAPVQSDVPERSVRRVAPLAPASSAAWSSGWPRPVRLLAPPEPIEAMALLPDHPPIRFTWRGTLYRVRRADGPERILGEWWRSCAEATAVRDYFQVEDEEGRRYWLFRRGDGADPATGPMRWFVHGLFG